MLGRFAAIEKLASLCDQAAFHGCQYFSIDATAWWNFKRAGAVGAYLLMKYFDIRVIRSLSYVKAY